MKRIPLTQNQFAIVDDRDFEKLSKFRWNACRDGNTFYARRLKGKYPKRTNVHMHREIMRCPKGKGIDHINGNGLDNRRENLRVSTSLGNARNHKVRKDNPSGFTGVSFFGKLKKWKAYIHTNKKQIHLGYFDTARDAAIAYDQAAGKIFGRFARLNFH